MLLQSMNDCSYLQVIQWHEYNYIMPLSSGYTDYLCYGYLLIGYAGRSGAKPKRIKCVEKRESAKQLIQTGF